MKKIRIMIGIILLFVGVTIAPTIQFNTVKASQENDLVEVTTQACGIQGYKDTTVKLTKEQYQDLEQYLVEFRARLNQTTTREEAVPIFKEAMVELDKYGLLPRGMSVQRAQELVIGEFQNERIKKLSKILYNKNQQKIDINVNAFCLIAGRSNNSLPTNFIANGLTYGGVLSFELGLLIGYNLYKKFPGLMFLLSPFWFLSSFALIALGGTIQTLVNINPLSLVNLIGIGSKSGSNVIADFGWVYTFGILGLQSWKGNLIGTLPGYIILFSPPLLFFPAIWGFNGIKIWLLESENWWEISYLGTAILVGLDEQ